MITWNEELRIGHPVIDADHQRLIEIINLFNARSENWEDDKILHETLKSLLAYGRDHFAREQKIQKECSYPECETHAAEHGILIGQVKEMAKEYFVEKLKPIDKTSIENMRDFLQHWLIDHILRYDTTMRGWVDSSSKESSSASLEVNLREKSIAIVANNFGWRSTLIQMFQMFGVRGLSIYNNGDEFIDNRDLTLSFDVLIFDDDMPRINCLKLIKYVRSSESLSFRKALAILTVGESSVGGIRNALDSGFHDILIKPFSANTLRQKIERLFKFPLPWKTQGTMIVPIHPRRGLIEN